MSVKQSRKDRYRFQLSFLHPRYLLTWIALSLFYIFTLLPMSVIDRIACWLGGIAAKNNRKRSNIAKTNLTLCFPDKSTEEIEHMVTEHFRAQFRTVMHYYILWWRSDAVVRKKIHKSGFEKITQYQQQGKNIIILLTHNVGLEFAGAAISMDYETVGPYKPMRNPVIDWMVANGRLRFDKSHSNKLFTRQDGLRPLIREVRAGKILGYFADEDLGEKNSVFASFYGVPKATIPVLGRLAKACNAVVLPCVSCYEEKSGHYLITLLPKIDDLSASDDVKDSESMNRAIERAIGFCPVQYMWTLRYFKTRPDGEKSVYDY